MSQNKNQLLTNELKELLRKRQLEWIDNGNEWSKGFVQGIEYILKENGEYNEDVKILLKPCPFCGGEAHISVCDSEGNHRNDEYENDPWSGLSFKIRHTHERNGGCPIANYEVDGGTLGVYLYDSREEASDAWNNRTYSAVRPNS